MRAFFPGLAAARRFRTSASSGIALPTPLAFWPLDEANGLSNATDTLGGFNLIISGSTPTVVSPGKGGAANARAFREDGSADNLLKSPISGTGDLAFGDSDPFTVLGWLYIISGGPNFQFVFSKYSGYFGGWNYLVQSDILVPKLHLGDGGNGTGTSCPASGAISADAWHFYVGIHDPVNSRGGVSIDGGAVNWTTKTASVVKNGTILEFGGGGSPIPLKGRLSQWGIVASAFDGTQISTAYNSGTGRTFNGTVWV